MILLTSLLPKLLPMILLRHLTIFIRFAKRTQTYFLINIFGLALATCCTILLWNYISFHTSFDRFHQDADRIARATMDSKFGNDEIHEATSMPPLAKALREDFPEVEFTVRLFDPNLFDKAIIVSRGPVSFKENDILYVDSSFFRVFSFKLLEGSPSQCLATPHSVVLTQSAKQKYFGTGLALGEQLILNGQAYVVSGIVEDTPPNSHFKFDFLASMISLPRSELDMWVNTPFYTYVKLKSPGDIQRLQSKLEAFIERHASSDMEKYFNTTYANLKKSGGKYDVLLQPLTDIHLHSNLDTELSLNEGYSRIRILASVAMFIVVIASINFINLTTALSSQRAKEIGVKKVLGSPRIELIKQFLFEALLYALLAVIVGLSFAWATLPAFNHLFGQQLTLLHFFSLERALLLIATTATLGMVSGLYPALFISRIDSTQILKGNMSGGFKNKNLRNALVVFQFSISLFLIICSLVFSSQMNFMAAKDLGFNKENVILLKNVSKLGSSLDAMKTQLKALPGVVSLSASREFPSSEVQILATQPEGMGLTKTFAFYLSDENFISTMNMQILEGRDFAPDFSADSLGAVLINESLRNELGLSSPIGLNMDVGKKAIIVGVFRDFHFQSLRNRIQPLAIYYEKDARRMDFLSIRYAANNVPKFIENLETTWKHVAADVPFEFSFLNEQLAQQYQQEAVFFQITIAFTVVSILISCIGLIGLVTFAVKVKEKDISIRKILGSSVTEIQLIFAKDIIRLIIVSSLVAIPASIWFIKEWLNEFSYHTELSVITFLMAVFVLSMITFGAVLYFTLKAAFINPMHALKTE